MENIISETAADVQQTADVMTELTDIRQLLTFIVVVLILAIAYFLFKKGYNFINQFFS